MVIQEPITDENYYSFPAMSNSGMTEFEKYWMPEDRFMDLRVAYANGTLIDAMITEPHKVDYFQLRVKGQDYQYSADEFERAKEMKKSFFRDAFCSAFIKQCEFQHITYVPDFEIEHEGIKFNMPAKCKWDLYGKGIDLSGDIKSTTATTQKQCEAAFEYFQYDRSRSWYMDLDKRNNDIVIFISKVNYKIFKIPIKRDGEIYKTGKAKYQKVCFDYWALFGGIEL